MALSNRMFRAAAVLAVGLAACDAGEPAACWTVLDNDAVLDVRKIPWTTLGEPALDQGGVADPVEAPLDPDTPWIAVRVSEPLDNPVCVQLHEVLDPDAGAWVTPPASLDDYRSYCRSCPERVSVGVGAGLYVLPSGDPPPPRAASLSIRAAARDCATFLSAGPGAGAPEGLRVEALPLPSVDEAQWGTVFVEVVITPGSIFYDSQEDLPEGIAVALEEVNRLFAPALLQVRAVRVKRLAGYDLLAFERGDYAALDALDADAHACDPDGAAPSDTWVPLVFAGCLEVSDPVQMQTEEPNGFVPRIPDGLARPGRGHGVFLKGRACRDNGPLIDWPAASLGKLMAHELGHTLGLYHAVESDGGLDNLDDTGEDNLMHWVSPTDALSAGQIRVMRRHPAVSWQ